MVAGSWRDSAVDAAHPLTALRQRWERRRVGVQELHLRPLPAGELAALLAEMLRVVPGEAARLAEVIGERTGGNPLDTVELLNALREDGALALRDDGWQWDPETIRRYVGTGGVLDLLADRLRRLLAQTREILQVMASAWACPVRRNRTWPLSWPRATTGAPAGLDAVQLIAGQLAISLGNAAVYRSLETRVAGRTRDLEAARQELELLSLTDPLTQVANRRQFEQEFAHRWRTASSDGSPLAVVILDIDHFKQYNDGFGHPAGDRCITAVAQAVTQAVREQDLVARYGGEEFAIILPGAPVHAAARVAERIRSAVTADQLPQALIDAADAALYRAMQNGRNRVDVAGGDPAQG